jgi:hypothetical protein
MENFKISYGRDDPAVVVPVSQQKRSENEEKDSALGGRR